MIKLTLHVVLETVNVSALLWGVGGMLYFARVRKGLRRVEMKERQEREAMGNSRFRLRNAFRILLVLQRL